MQYPYERFLRYLVSRKVDVDGRLARIGLPLVGAPWTRRVLGELKRSAPEAVRQYLDSRESEVAVKAGFLEWAESVEIRLLWEQEREFRQGAPDPTLVLAHQLFSASPARSVLGTLLLCQLSADDVRQIMQERCGVVVASSLLPVYEAIFWDHRGTSAQAWQEIARAASAEAREYLSLGFRKPPVDVNQVRHALGLGTKNEPNEVLGALMEHAFYSFLDAARGQRVQKSDSLKWAERAARAAREAKGGGTGTAELVPETGRFELFSVKVDKTAMPTLAELEGELTGTVVDPEKPS